MLRSFEYLPVPGRVDASLGTMCSVVPRTGLEVLRKGLVLFASCSPGHLSRGRLV